MERVEETLDTLMPMLPDIQYFRFNPGKLIVTIAYCLIISNPTNKFIYDLIIFV